MERGFTVIPTKLQTDKRKKLQKKKNFSWSKSEKSMRRIHTKEFSNKKQPAKKSLIIKNGKKEWNF